MSDYEPSPAEIEAALESWFPDAEMGWKGNPNFANRAFWRQSMRAALVAANRARILLLAAAPCVESVRRIVPAPLVGASSGRAELMMIPTQHVAAVGSGVGHEHLQC